MLYRWTDRQVDRRMHVNVAGQTDRWTETDNQTDDKRAKQKTGQTGRQQGRKGARQTGKKSARLTDGKTDRLKERKTEKRWRE